MRENRPEKLRVKDWSPLFPEAHFTYCWFWCISLAQDQQGLASEYIRHCFMLLHDSLIFVPYLVFEKLKLKKLK